MRDALDNSDRRTDTDRNFDRATGNASKNYIGAGLGINADQKSEREPDHNSGIRNADMALNREGKINQASPAIASGRHQCNRLNNVFYATVRYRE